MLLVGGRSGRSEVNERRRKGDSDATCAVPGWSRPSFVPSRAGTDADGSVIIVLPLIIPGIRRRELPTPLDGRALCWRVSMWQVFM